MHWISQEKKNKKWGVIHDFRSSTFYLLGFWLSYQSETQTKLAMALWRFIFAWFICSNSRFRINALKVVIWGKLLLVHFWAKTFCSLLSIVTSQGSIASSWNNEQIYQSTDIWLGILKWAGNRGNNGTGLINCSQKLCQTLDLVH